MTAFDAAAIQSLLEALDEQLAARGTTADIYLVGGAAIALSFDATRTTRDLDAVFAPTTEVRAAARNVADQFGLAEDWLNDAVPGFVPPVGADDWVEIHRVRAVVVSIGSPEMLLAMKLFANRGIRDTEDIEYLLGVCQITSLAQAQEIYERYHAQDVITDSAALRIQAWLDAQ
jgi:hypothetical protein